MRRTDIVCSALLFAAGLFVLFWVIPAYVVTGAQTEADLSPAFMPYIAATIGTGAAGLLLVARLLPVAADGEPAPLPKESWYFIGAASGVLGLSFALMSYAGYLYAGAALVAGFTALARASLKVTLATAVAFPIMLWLLFNKLLGFPLP